MFTIFSETLSFMKSPANLGMVQCQKDQRKDARMQEETPLKGETPYHFRMFFCDVFTLDVFVVAFSSLGLTTGQ